MNFMVGFQSMCFAMMNGMMISKYLLSLIFNHMLFDWRFSLWESLWRASCGWCYTLISRLQRTVLLEVSWTELFTILYIDGIRKDLNLNPICISANGDIMLQLDSVVLLYNSKDNTFKHLLTDQHFTDLNVCTYVEYL